VRFNQLPSGRPSESALKSLGSGARDPLGPRCHPTLKRPHSVPVHRHNSVFHTTVCMRLAKRDSLDGPGVVFAPDLQGGTTPVKFILRARIARDTRRMDDLYF
jgi:hypothetical protein